MILIWRNKKFSNITFKSLIFFHKILKKKNFKNLAFSRKIIFFLNLAFSYKIKLLANLNFSEYGLIANLNVYDLAGQLRGPNFWPPAWPPKWPSAIVTVRQGGLVHGQKIFWPHQWPFVRLPTLVLSFLEHYFLKFCSALKIIPLQFYVSQIRST